MISRSGYYSQRYDVLLAGTSWQARDVRRHYAIGTDELGTHPSMVDRPLQRNVIQVVETGK